MLDLQRTMKGGPVTIGILPVEMMQMIFAFALQLGIHAWPNEERVRVLFYLMGACRRWRSILLNEGRVWGDMVTADGTLKWLDLCLGRSKGAPLNLTSSSGLLDAYGRMRPTVRLLMQTRYACRLSIVDIQLQDNDCARTLVDLVNAAPNLRLLSVSHRENRGLGVKRARCIADMDVESGTRAKAPGPVSIPSQTMLTTLKLTYTLHIFDKTLLSNQLFRNLQTLSLVDDPSGFSRPFTGNECLHALAAVAGSLTSLTLSNVLWSQHPDEEDMGKRVSLDKLEKVAVTGEYISVLLLLERVVLPKGCSGSLSLTTAEVPFTRSKKFPRPSPFRWEDTVYQHCTEYLETLFTFHRYPFWHLVMAPKKFSIHGSMVEAGSREWEVELLYAATPPAEDVLLNLLDRLAAESDDPDAVELDTFSLELVKYQRLARLSRLQKLFKSMSTVTFLTINGDDAMLQQCLSQMGDLNAAPSSNGWMLDTPAMPNLESLRLPYFGVMSEADDWRDWCSWFAWRRGMDCPIRLVQLEAYSPTKETRATAKERYKSGFIALQDTHMQVLIAPDNRLCLFDSKKFIAQEKRRREREEREREEREREERERAEAEAHGEEVMRMEMEIEEVDRKGGAKGA
ncbi:hypothetical protein MD484_g5506, partial [Candolleomyces efflorescens]